MKLMSILYSAFFLLTSSCIGIEDKEGMVPKIRYLLVNSTSYPVTVHVAHSNIKSEILDSTANPGDTIQYWKDFFTDVITEPFGTPPESVTVILEFVTSAPKCLSFSGRNGYDSDIRFQDSYSNSSISQSNQIIKYFTITNDNFNSAQQCR